MTDDDDNGDESVSIAQITTAVGEVYVEDEDASLEEVEETAERLLDRAEKIHEKERKRFDSGGMYQ